MAGTIKLDGTTFLSKSGSDFTLNNVTDIGTVTSGTFNGTVGSTATFPAGHQELISTQTASSVASITFSSSLITDTYDDYILDIVHAVPATNATHAYIEMSIDNGTPLGSIKTGRHYMQLGGASAGHEQNDTTAMVIAWSMSNTVSEGGVSSRVLLPGLRNASSWKHGSYFSSARHSTSEYAWHGGYQCPTTSAINWLNFKFSSGNVATGRFNLYGIIK